jgi:hypothetical protein
MTEKLTFDRADPYAKWRKLLAGELSPDEMHESEPLPGFYRSRSKDKGEQWPDLSPAVLALGHNAPPEGDTFESLKDQINELKREAETLIKAGGAKTQAEADQASHLANKLAELQKKAEEQRKIEKKPHDDAARAVQQKWMPIIDAADIYRRIKAVVITPFLKKLDDERIAAETAARKARRKPPRPGADPRACAGSPRAGQGGQRRAALGGAPNRDSWSHHRPRCRAGIFQGPRRDHRAPADHGGESRSCRRQGPRHHRHQRQSSGIGRRQ